MKTLKPLPLIGMCFLAASFSMIADGSPYGQKSRARRLSPNALVADLYRAHNHKRGPFFQTRSRVLLDKYFEKSLADLIWKDAVTAKGEVGALDGDPLYNAQDLEIKNFAIGKPDYADGKAKVVVTFQNFGKPNTIIFILVNGRAGWRIYDIDWSDGNTLRKILAAASPKN